MATKNYNSLIFSTLLRSWPTGCTSLSFQVKRHASELIAPTTQTPRELKPLSDIDDQGSFRYILPIIQVYSSNPEMGNTNPVSVIRDALAKLLVFYYPLAGRIKEGPGRKLMVDCTGDGVLFVEADANITLEQFLETFNPPFTYVRELFCNVPNPSDIIGSPLLQIQVTRLLCGAFIFTTQFNHTMCDGAGVIQFLTALGEMARGAVTPSILPVWQRELLCARDPLCVTFPHQEYDNVVHTEVNHKEVTDEKVRKLFFFGPTEMSALRRFVPENIKSCTNFEVLTACLWRCRTIALQPNPKQDTRLNFSVNARAKFNPCIPVGYYGNCIAAPCVISKVEDLCNGTLGHALELIRDAKSRVTEEYVRSIADLMVVKGRPCMGIDSTTFLITDLSKFGLNKVNFGWGEAIYVELDQPDYSYFSSYMPFTNKGESGIVVRIGFSTLAIMEKFVYELNTMLT